MSASYIATVTKEFEIVPTKSWGDRLVINFDASGIEKKIWSKPDDTELKNLKKGTKVRLIEKNNSKGNPQTTFLEIISEGSPQVSNNEIPVIKKSSDPYSYLGEKRNEMIKVINKHINLHKHIYDNVETVYSDYALSSEDKRTISTAVFIDVVRRYL